MASKFTGIRNANDFAFGLATSSGTGPQPLRVLVGNPGAGTYTITLDYGVVFTFDGKSFLPLSTTSSITVGSGANQETISPSAITNPTPGVYGTCQLTAVFANAHGNGDPVATATYGLSEAVLDAHVLGGLVAVDGAWAAAGGVTGTITGAKGFTNVCVLDWRGTTGAVSYKAASNGAAMAATTTALY